MVSVSEAIAKLSDNHSEDANILLVLLSFLSTSENVPLHLLFRGATPRRRWTVSGDVKDSGPIHAGLAPQLGSFLSDIRRLGNAFHELELSSAVSEDSDQIYTVNDAVVRRVQEGLSSECVHFWRCQALIVAYRAIPWKYLEFA